MRKSTLLIALILFTIPLTLFGCGDSGSEAIGKWIEYSQYEYDKDRCEFFTENSFYLDEQGLRFSGRWSVLDDGRIKIEVNKRGVRGVIPESTFLASVKGDELLLDIGGGRNCTYVRGGSQLATEIESRVKKAAAERERERKAEKRAAEQIEKEKRDFVRQQREIARKERARLQMAEREWKAARVAYDNGLYKETIAKLEKAIELGSINAQNSLAWVLATCKDKKFQDSKRAVDLALKASAQKPCLDFFSTLAAAYASNGQFNEAVDAQLTSLSYGHSRDGKKRLKLYRQGNAYQEK
jgi:hypothetical protein